MADLEGRRPLADAWIGWQDARWRYARADRAGRCAPPPPGVRTFHAGARGFHTRQVRWLSADARAGLTVLLRKKERIEIRVPVTDRQGRPLAGALLSATIDGEEVVAWSDADGIARLVYRGGKERLRFPCRVQARGHRTVRVQVYYRVYHGLSVKDQEDTGAIVLDPRADVAGRVVDAAGEPLAGKAVVLGWSRGRQVHEWTATTDLSGRYLLEELPAGRRLYGRIEVGCSPRTEVVELPAGESRLDWTVPPTPEVKGVLTDPDGRPLSDLWIELHLLQENGSVLIGRDRTKRSGRFHVRRVALRDRREALHGGAFTLTLAEGAPYTLPPERWRVPPRQDCMPHEVRLVARRK